MTAPEQPASSVPEGLTADFADRAAPFSPKIVHFTDLARCGDEIWIEYEGKLYRLQSTRQGKLILTK
ncbi:hemin uptake protein HemP [Stieleria varia]|nr:hemin uptake protein HemP [Stieleria varia]